MKTLFDPEPTGYHNYPPKSRNLKRFRHLQDRRNRTRALSECVGTLPDGSQYIVRKIAGKTVGELVTLPTKSVKIRKRELKSGIVTYIDIAERVGLNPKNVAKLYRERRDNGYTVTHTIDIQTNATFRGGDF